MRNSIKHCPRLKSSWLAAAISLGALGWLFSLTVVWGEMPMTPPPASELSARDLHVWGRFDPGTWKRVRIVTETLDDHGAVADTTTTESKTTLVRADAKRVTLRIEAMVNVAGKRFAIQPQVVEYGYYGESPNEPTDLKTLGSESLMVDGRQVPCRIEQVVASAGQQKQVTQMFLSDAVEPFVLKRETALFKKDGTGENTLEDPQTTTEVIALDVPYKVLQEIKSTAYERTIQRSTRGTNVTLDVTSVDVPGGIVARTSKELDPVGRLLRRSTLELVDYQVVDNEDDNNSAVDKSGDKNNALSLTRRQARKARKH
jgi:hypothetical protein